MKSTKKKLYPGWSPAVQGVMDEGVAVLPLAAKVIQAWEAAGILTIYDLLLRSLEEISAVSSFGDKAFDTLKLSMKRLGFRRARTRYSATEPLLMLFEGCFPPVTDPMDLVEETPRVAAIEPLLTHRQALDRATAGLEKVMEHFKKGSRQYNMLSWIWYYARTRLPEPEKEE